MENDDMQRHYQPTPTTEGKLPKPADLATVFDEVAMAQLILRRPQMGDKTMMFAVHGDPETNLYNPDGPDPDLATSEERLRDWIQHWETYGFGYWTTLHPQTEQIIGFGGVRHLIWRDRDVLNLYYRFTPSTWGQGYATELAQMAVTLARKHLSIWPVVARTRTMNIASIRIAEKAGLVRHPELDTEHMVFALGWTF